MAMLVRTDRVHEHGHGRKQNPNIGIKRTNRPTGQMRIICELDGLKTPAQQPCQGMVYYT